MVPAGFGSQWSKRTVTEPIEPSPEEPASRAEACTVFHSGEPPSQPSQTNGPQHASTLLHQVRPLLLAVPLLTLLTGVIFPLLLAIIAFPLFRHQAKGSLV